MSPEAMFKFHIRWVLAPNEFELYLYNMSSSVYLRILLNCFHTPCTQSATSSAFSFQQLSHDEWQKHQLVNKVQAEDDHPTR